jgi:hypothetical protein
MSTLEVRMSFAIITSAAGVSAQRATAAATLRTEPVRTNFDWGQKPASVKPVARDLS